MITIEDVLDKISNVLISQINNFDGTEFTVKANQKVIRDGLIQPAGSTVIQPGERLVLFDQDTLANSEDVVELENTLITLWPASWPTSTTYTGPELLLEDDNSGAPFLDITIENATPSNDTFGGWTIWLRKSLGEAANITHIMFFKY